MIPTDGETRNVLSTVCYVVSHVVFLSGALFPPVHFPACIPNGTPDFYRPPVCSYDLQGETAYNQDKLSLACLWGQSVEFISFGILSAMLAATPRCSVTWNVHTSFRVHPVFHSIDTRDSFPRSKAASA